MCTADLPENEVERLAALLEYNIIDTQPEEAFDDLTRLAAHICETPMAAVTLVDHERQWFKSKVGLSACETSRRIAFCSYAILDPAFILEVGDARLDPRFAHNPLVTGEPHIRFYAGAPLVTPDGMALGTLCVIDHQPRQLTEGQHDSLGALSRQVIAQLELHKKSIEFKGLGQPLHPSHRELKNFTKAAIRRYAAELKWSNKALTAANAKLEAELASRTRAERRFSEVIHSAPNAILMIAQDGRIVLANQQAENLLGYDADTLCTLPVEALMPQTIRGEHEEKRKQYAQSPSIRAMGEKQELFALHRDGRYIPVDIGLTPIESDEGPMVVAALIDLTDRKAAEKALKAHAKELERSNQELDRFAYIASHDLKAPLRAIDHLAHWIAEDAGEVLPESSRADLVLLQQRVGRMAELLDSLLAYSRIGRNQSEPEAIDLGCLVRDILAMLEIPDAFTVTVAADLPTLQAPKTPVDLVLRNLIGNALKHHDRADGCLAISGRDLGDRVEVMVADDGPGIAPVYHEQIFQMFQTLKPRDEVEGSGIGLALVKKTVEHYGGTIAVEAEETAGAQFRLTWPKHPTRRT